jgi:hypothetical protein
VESPSGILSSDADTYLRTAIEAAAELNDFRRDLRSLQQREAGGESERRHRPTPVDEGPKVEEQDGRWEPKVEEEDDYGMTAPAPVEKKSSKKKGSREDGEPRGEKRGVAAPHQDLQASPASEKRRKKKEKGVKVEIETEYATEEQSRKALGDALRGMVSEEGIDSEKKAKKKKHIKQEEEEVMKEVEQKMLHAGVAENGLASEEKKRKKRKHTEEEEVKKEVVDGDLGSEKKRKKKRGRDGDNANDSELVENAKKKQRK